MMQRPRASVVLSIVWVLLLAQSAVASHSVWHQHHDCDDSKGEPCLVCTVAKAERIQGDDTLAYPEFDAIWGELIVREPRTADSRPLPAARARGPPA